MSLQMRLVVLAAIVLPFAGVIASIALVWPFGFHWTHLWLMIGGYILTGMGITMGYHRLFTHKSFDTGPVLTAVLGILGSMALEGPVIRWVATHRCHHKHSDDDLDPHSPHSHGGGVRNMIRGMWHAHSGWIFQNGTPDPKRYAPDLMANPLVRFIDRLFPVWVALSLLIPTVIAGAISGTWTGAMLGFIWGGLVRIFVVHHITWSINSVCHVWGGRPYDSHDESRNNLICGILGLGEGWHNNHHAFPASARHGLEWWQFDSTYIGIRILEAIGLVRAVRVPPRERIESKRRV